MPLLGIDLGTTFSAMAHLDANGTPITVPNAEGELTTPSVVLFEPNGDVVVGREARRAALAEPDRVAECVKRYMGDALFPKKLNGEELSPVAISAMILKKLKQDAEKRIGRIAGAVITVPAYFDEGRRQATAFAGELAGLKVIDIINEPTSAALAYAYRGLLKSHSAAAAATDLTKVLDAAPARTAVVYDLGGGTFDVTAMRIEGNRLTVLATAGDVKLGGRDWDERLFAWMAEQFVEEYGSDPRTDPVSAQALMLTAEETKRVLTLRQQASFVVNHAGRSFRGEVTREAFDDMTGDLLFRSESRLERVIGQAGLKWDKVDQVLAVGGSTRMPQVLQMLRRVSGKDADCSLSPDEAVAHGAAIHVAACAVNAARARAAKIAARQKAASGQPAQDPRGGGDAARPPQKPGDVAAAGPAAPAGSNGGPLPLPPLAAKGAPAGDVPESAADADAGGTGLMRFFKERVVVLLRSIRTTNVNAHSLGVVVTRPDDSQAVSVLVPHNTQIPCSVKRRFGTIRDNQTHVTVRVVEGEARDPAECMQVGSCQIEPLPIGLPKGSPVEVTFKYDASGRLGVEAVDVTSGNWAAVTIERRSGASRGPTRHLEEEKVARAAVS